MGTNTHTLASEVGRFIERLRLFQGHAAGQSFRLHGWQRRFLVGAFGQPDDAGVSLARGGGKSTFTAGIAAATVAPDGPLVEPHAETVVVAASFEQGHSSIFRAVLQFLQPYVDQDSRAWRIQDSLNHASIEHRPTGARVRVMGNKPRTLHGLQARLLVLDEVAQWEPAQLEASLAALETSRGKITGSKALWLGTRPASAEHPFEKALQGGLGYSQVHAARSTDPPFRRTTWKRANPGLDHLPDLEAVIRREARKAKLDPAALAHFEALRLNMGKSDTLVELVLDAATWQRVEGDAPAVGPYVLGLDLSGSAAMTGFAGYWPQSGRLEGLACFPRTPGLAERGLRDGVGDLYVRCHKRDELVLLGEFTPDLEEILRLVLRRWGTPAAIVCDQERWDILEEKLMAVGFPRAAATKRKVGFISGGQDMKRFRDAVLEDKVTPCQSLLMRSAMAEARTVTDAAGNQKIAKASEGGRRLRARDDVIAACILAVAEGTRRGAAPPRSMRYAIVG